MSQSIQDYTSFAIQFPSEQGMTRQNVRLTPMRVRSLLLVCVLLFAFSAGLVAQQPPTYDLRIPSLTVDNAIGNQSIWTNASDVTLINGSGVYGSNTAGRPANWWVAGDLNNWGTSGIRYLSNLTVKGDLDNRSGYYDMVGTYGGIHDVSNIRVDGNLSNHGMIMDGDTTEPVMLGTVLMPSTIIVGGNLANQGTISNFTSIYASGLMSNQGTISDIHSIVVSSDVPSDITGVGSFRNSGSLENITSITVSDKIFFDEGTDLLNVGTITAGRAIEINGEVHGGFGVLATTGELSVRGSLLTVNTSVPAKFGSLIIDTGSVVSASSIVNDSTIFNNNGGVLSSATNIRNTGTIRNDGVISAVGSVVNSGTIFGNGMVSVGRTGLVQNTSSGTILGTFTVNGDFQNNGGTLHLTQSNGRDIDTIRVANGTAYINGGRVDATDFQGVAGMQYLFLSTEKPGSLAVSTPLGITGNYTPGSVLNFAPEYGYWDGTRYVRGDRWSDRGKIQYYWLEMKRAYQYGPTANTPNRRAVGEYLDTIGTSPVRNSALWNMFQQLDGISERAGIPHNNPIDPLALEAVDELSGVIYANLGASSVHNYGTVMRTLADNLRSDVFKFSMIGNPNNAIRGQAIAPLRYTRWGTLFGIGGNTQADGSNVDGYKTSFGGAMAGIDRAMWTGTRMGVFLSAALGDVRLKKLDESSDITSISVGMYFRQEMYYGYGLAAAGFGVDNYETQRSMTLLGHTAKSKTDATIGTVYLERGIDIPVYYATIQPYTSFQVVSVTQDAFTESMRNQTGTYTVNPFGLEGVKGDTNSFKMALGMRSSTQPIPMRWGQLALTTNLAWLHEFNGKNDRDFIGRYSNPGGQNFGTQFSDTTFRIYGNDPKRDWVNFGLGFNMDRNSTRTFVAADLFSNNRQTLFSASGGVVTSW